MQDDAKAQSGFATLPPAGSLDAARPEAGGGGESASKEARQKDETEEIGLRD
jgi:ribosomal protein L12E/L44/L45/RPP1/RPP2